MYPGETETWVGHPPPERASRRSLGPRTRQPTPRIHLLRKSRLQESMLAHCRFRSVGFTNARPEVSRKLALSIQLVKKSLACVFEQPADICKHGTSSGVSQNIARQATAPHGAVCNVANRPFPAAHEAWKLALWGSGLSAS